MALKLDPGQMSTPQNASGAAPARHGQLLPQSFRHQMEAAFGADFSAIRIHEGHQATHVGAIAYTQGTNIHLAPGHASLASSHCQEIIGHELAHVVQQRSGARIPNVPRGMVEVDLEAEANSLGERAGM
ncbi:DUF4157 domain-containing protein [Singulisphaera sp. Ch08]|uniref:DUF4157 domain-containing protein n=1 Tax=Singulisphaera sp. Ch08 TaxID=3120278 RepID=A0AAU7C7V6_9BACT